MRTRLNPLWTALQEEGAVTPEVPAPYFFPYQFYVGGFVASTYGAVGNGKVVSDGAMTIGSHTFTSASITAADAGKAIVVSGAGGGAFTPLATTISSAGAGSATLAAAATSSVSQAVAYYGTDDTAAIAAAQAAAVAYAQAGNGYAEIIFDPLMYCIAGAPVIGGATLGNAQIPLPIIVPTSQKITIVYRGVLDVTALPHWLQQTPQASGTVLACMRADGTNDIANGPASVIGGPYNGYGGGTVTNLLVTVDGISMLVPYNTTYCGWDFWGLAEANVITGACMAAAVPPPTPIVPTMVNSANISNQWTFGLRMPSFNNNDNCNIGWWSAEGLCYGVMPSEHTAADSIRAVYCIIGVETYSGAGTPMPHAGQLNYVSAEVCQQAIGFLDNTINIDVETLDVESAGAFFDPNNYGIGTIGWRVNGSGHYQDGGIGTGGANLRVIQKNMPPGPQTAGAPAAPASTVPQFNWYYRDAQVWLSTSGGSITAVSVGGLTLPITAGTDVGPVAVPSGKSYTVTYTGTLSTAWVLY